MKATKHILALLLSLAMIFSMIVASGVMTASAIAGGGLPTTYYRAYGVDLSFWNGTVDFAKLKASGCQFAILRIGYEGSSSRTDTLDTKFLTYYNDARAAGMPLGVYFYSLATTYAGAKQDAQWVMNQIESRNMYFEYPIYYDIEDSTYTYQTSLGSAAMEQLALGWCETLEANGYLPGIYGGGTQVIDKLSSSFKAKYDTWYPRYKSMDASNQFASNYKDYSSYCCMWQFAIFNNSTYSGLSSNTLDKNVCYKDYPSITSKYGYNNCEGGARTELEELVSKAKSARYDHYTEQALAVLRATYNEAVSLLNNSSATDSSLSDMSAKLEKALNNTVANNENVISVGKSYTATASGRTDTFVDDGKRLTDGAKGTTDGGTDKFSGFNSNDPIDVVVDLGGNVSSNTYRIYAAKMEEWGIPSPAKLTISVSNDGTNFTTVDSTEIRYRTYASDGWNMFTYTVKSDTTRTERYVKFTVTPGANHVWLEEVQVMNNPIAATGKIYVTGMNKYIYAGDTVIFTPDQSPITASNHNISYTTNVVATWNGSSYVISSISTGTGTDTPDIALNSNQILIATHDWEYGTDDPIIGSSVNAGRLKGAKIGDSLSFTNVDINGKSLSVTPTIQVISVTSEPVEKPDNAKTFWVTHVNDNTSEGAGTIFTSSYEGAGWWLHVAFKPVSGKDGVYEIVNLSNGIDDGKATALAIPAGGFVWAINKGNDYPSLGLGDTDYTSPNCDAMIAIALQWQIGDKFTFYGINPIAPAVSTSTPGSYWYDDAYVCTSYFAPYSEGTVTPPPVVKGQLGDVNNDGSIDQYDYLLVKRHYFETRYLTSDEMGRGDVNKDGTVNQFDYILIARHYFGTFTIKG